MASISWRHGAFKIMTPEGWATVNGLLGEPFGIREEPRRWQSVWTVTHLATGLRVTLGNGAGFLDPEFAKQFAEQLLPLADWDRGSALAEDATLCTQVTDLWNELIERDFTAANARRYRADERQSRRRRPTHRKNQ